MSNHQQNLRWGLNTNNNANQNSNGGKLLGQIPRRRQTSHQAKPPKIQDVLTGAHKEFARRIEVTEISQHSDGHTEYKVLLKVVPRNSIDQDPLCFVVWARYKEIWKFWQKLALCHKQLHLHGAFPDYPKPKLLGKKDPSIIEERRSATESFLQFVVDEPVLSRTSIIVNFFEDAEVPSDERQSLNLATPPIPPTQPIETEQSEPPGPAATTVAVETAGAESNQSASTSTKMNESNTNRREPAIEGPEAVVAADDPNMVVPEDRTVSAPNIAADVQGTTSSSRGHPPQNDSITLNVPDGGDLNRPWSSSDLFAIQDCHIPLAGEEQTAPGVQRTPETHQSHQGTGGRGGQQESPVTMGLPSSINSLDSDTNNGGSTMTQKMKSRIAKFFPKMTTSRSEMDIQNGSQQDGQTTDAVVGRGASTGELNRPQPDQMRSLSPGPPIPTGGSPSTSISPARSPRMRRKNDDDYLVQAAHFISSAQKSEAEGAYDLAFSCYKTAVNLMLQGVQHEKDLARRNAVRKKTSKYLLKAERIYRSYLAFDSSTFDVGKWAADFTISSPSVQDPTLISFQGSKNELSQFKFLSKLDDGMYKVELKENLLLANSPIRQQARCFALKFMDKTWNFHQSDGTILKSSANIATSGLSSAENIVPLNVAYMVNLIKFYETELSVILLLEFIQPGRLWDFLSDYFRYRRHLIQAAAMELSAACNRTTLTKNGKNKYVGRQVLFSVGSDPAAPIVESDDDEDGDGEDVGEEDDGREGDSAGGSSRIKQIITGSKYVEGRPVPEPERGLDSLTMMNDGAQSSSASRVSASSKKDSVINRDSLDSTDSMSIDTSNVQGTSAGTSLPSPNPDLKFQSVFKKIASDMTDFSIIDEDSVLQSPTAGLVPAARRSDSDETDTPPVEKEEEQGDSPSQTFSQPTPAADRIQNDNNSQLDESLGKKSGQPSIDTDSHADEKSEAENPAKNARATAENIEKRTNESKNNDDHGNSQLQNQNQSKSTGNTRLQNFPPTSSSTTTTINNSDSPLPASFPPFDIAQSRRLKQELINAVEFVKTLIERGERWPAEKELPECLVQYWIGQLIVALTHVHAEGIIVKDLKPSNLLLNKNGQLVLTYQSEWGCVDQVPDKAAFADYYAGPEIGGINSKDVKEGADWWSVGVILYELLTGIPLNEQCQQGITSRTSIPFLSNQVLSPLMSDDGQSETPKLSQKAIDLLTRLLVVNASERLGQPPGGVEDIRSHPFMANLPWSLIDNPQNAQI